MAHTLLTMLTIICEQRFAMEQADLMGLFLFIYELNLADLGGKVKMIIRRLVVG